MALNQAAQISLSIALFGILAFVFGVFAETHKPPLGTPINGEDVIICMYPTDPSIELGLLSMTSLAVATLLGVISVLFPYEGKSVPRDALFSNTLLTVYFTIAMLVAIAGEGMLLWATVTEALHHIRNVHRDLATECATAKTGVFGGAAFVALNASLFWLVCQMLTHNVREDYLQEDVPPEVEYGEVLSNKYHDI